MKLVFGLLAFIVAFFRMFFGVVLQLSSGIAVVKKNGSAKCQEFGGGARGGIMK